jgi:WhiB family redox-sensing transcriptional regulator
MQYPAPVQPLAPVAPSFDGNQPCAYVDPDLFFPPLGRAVPVVRAAKAVCATCRFMQPCLEYAVARPDLLGIWGGTTERERAALRRARGHIKHPVAVAS